MLNIYKKLKFFLVSSLHPRRILAVSSPCLLRVFYAFLRVLNGGICRVETSRTRSECGYDVFQYLFGSVSVTELCW